MPLEVYGLKSAKETGAGCVSGHSPAPATKRRTKLTHENGPWSQAPWFFIQNYEATEFTRKQPVYFRCTKQEFGRSTITNQV